MKPRKDCPYCGEKIKAIAIRCKHCYANLTADASHPAAAISKLPTLNTKPSILNPSDILELLSALVERSLIAVDLETGRYRLLETVRQYARDRLEECGEAEPWRDSHLNYFLKLGEEAEPHLTEADQQEWLERLEIEHDNIRAALTWSSEEDGDPEDGLRLAGALWHFWQVRGYLGEGRGRLSLLLTTHSSGLLQTASRAKALNGAGVLAYRQGDYLTARALTEESLEIHRELGDRHGIAGSLNILGNLAYEQGDYPSARALHEESLEIHRELGDQWGIATSLGNLGLVVYEQGDYPSARALHEESLAIRQGLGDRRGVAISLNNLGLVAHDQCDYPAANALYEQSLTTFRELGERRGIAHAMNNLGNVAIDLGDYPAAYTFHQESLAIRRELGDRWGTASSLSNLGNVAHLQGDYPAAYTFHEQSLKIRRELGGRSGIASSLEGLAPASAALGSPDRAARLWGAAAALREQIGAPISSNELPRYDGELAAARAALNDDAAFEAAWADGRAMTLEQAITLALEE